MLREDQDTIRAAQAAAGGASPPVEDGASLLKRVAELRDELLVDGELLALAISSWPDGALVARFGVLPPSEILECNAADEGVHRSINLLARACRGLYVRNERRQYQRVEHQGHPVLFDQQLAEMLELPADTDVYRLVLHLYKGNELAITNDALELGQWMRDTSQEVDGQVVGEFVDGRLSSASVEPSDTAPSEQT